MGYRAENNRDEDDRNAWRQLPWRDRYGWHQLAVALIIVAAFAVGLLLWVSVPTLHVLDWRSG